MPKKSKNTGFTLVELLVVITIIAILATIGLTIYTSAQKQARDAKRRGDIDAIAKALETKKGTSPTYPQLSSTDFTNGIPYDPLTTAVNVKGPASCGTKANNNTGYCWYCGYSTSDPTNASIAPLLVPQNCATDYGYISSMGSNTDWIICANLEAGGFYCRNNQR